MLTIFGSINIDQVIRVESIPAPGETVLGERVMDAHGGKGANQAIAAARASAGDVPVTMIGAVGDDAHGHNAKENFLANNVVPEVETISDSATGTAIITLSKDGENAITVVSGANAHLSHTHPTRETLERTSVLLCQGEVDFEETFRAMEALRAVRPDSTILLNLAPVPANANIQMIGDALNICDALIVNETEADSVISLLRSDDLANLSTIARRHRCSIVRTRGPMGAELFTPSGENEHISSPRIDPIDTTGAGDTFCGVLAILLAEGLHILPALALACSAAAKACGAIGAQTAMPQRSDFSEDSVPS